VRKGTRKFAVGDQKLQAVGVASDPPVDGEHLGDLLS
jgi:hypothetical protein